MYDITEFVASHPGGKDKIMQAAGGALEPFWDLYTVHTTTAWESISALLETYKIGCGKADVIVGPLLACCSALAVQFI